MTREESKSEVIKKFKAKCVGKELSEAIVLHFKKFEIPNLKREIQENPIDILNSPLVSGGLLNSI